MTIANSSSARRAGFKVNDAAILDVAAISMAKIGCRTLYVPLPLCMFHPAGGSIGTSLDGIANIISCDDAGASNLYASFRLPAQWDSGNITVTIYWKTVATTGNAKFTVDLASKAVGGTTALEETVTVTTAAQTTASKLNVSQAVFTAADFTAADLVGLKITRDGTAVGDTIAAQLQIAGVAFEFTGRG